MRSLDELRALLEVDSGATTEEIEQAYRQKARLYHPDRPGGGNPDTFRLLGTAKEVLSNREATIAYEEQYKAQADTHRSGIDLKLYRAQFANYYKWMERSLILAKFVMGSFSPEAESTVAGEEHAFLTQLNNKTLCCTDLNAFIQRQSDWSEYSIGALFFELLHGKGGAPAEDTIEEAIRWAASLQDTDFKNNPNPIDGTTDDSFFIEEYKTLHAKKLALDVEKDYLFRHLNLLPVCKEIIKELEDEQNTLDEPLRILADFIRAHDELVSIYEKDQGPLAKELKDADSKRLELEYKFFVVELQVEGNEKNEELSMLEEAILAIQSAQTVLKAERDQILARTAADPEMPRGSQDTADPEETSPNESPQAAPETPSPVAEADKPPTRITFPETNFAQLYEERLKKEEGEGEGRPASPTASEQGGAPIEKSHTPAEIEPVRNCCCTM